MRPHGQLVLGIVGPGHGMRNVVAVGEGQRISAAIRPELATDAAGYTRDTRHAEGHHAILARDVGLPADPRQRVAVAHEKPVAEVLRARGVVRPRCAVEHAEGDLASPVGHVEKKATAAPAEGAEQVEVRRGLDSSRGVPRGKLEVSDGLVHGQARIHLEAEHPHDLLVGAGRAEGGAVQHGLASFYLESHHGHGIPPLGCAGV